MKENTTDIGPRKKRNLSPTTKQILADRDASLPVWIRPPTAGQEFYSGLTRPKLYELASNGHIRSVSLREPGRIKGVRVFHLQSIFEYFEEVEAGCGAQNVTECLEKQEATR